MRGVFDEREAERDRRKRNREDRNDLKPDREVTLGSFTLLAILLGLVVLCGLSFGLGLVVGRREPAATSTVLEPTPIASQGDGSKTKPSGGVGGGGGPVSGGAASEAEGLAGAEASGQHAGGLQQGSDAGDTRPEAGGAKDSKGTPQGAQGAAGAGHVQPALSAVPVATKPQQSQTLMVQPALASAATKAPAAAAVALMVQVATLAHQDDADVLVEALRRRGFTVTAHRDVVDGMVHVRVGPFASREVANEWRQKLLSDGYNAQVESE